MGPSTPSWSPCTFPPAPWREDKQTGKSCPASTGLNQPHYPHGRHWRPGSGEAPQLQTGSPRLWALSAQHRPQAGGFPSGAGEGPGQGQSWVQKLVSTSLGMTG